MSSRRENAKQSLNVIIGEFNQVNGGPLRDALMILALHPGENPHFLVGLERALTEEERGALPTVCEGFEVKYD